jgi:5-methylcytosine-specific restriction endonuclease McrA
MAGVLVMAKPRDRRAYMKVWRKKNRARINAYSKAWIAAHPEYHAVVVARARDWMKKQPRERYRGWRNAIDQRRRARKLGATLGPVSLATALIEYNGLCGICNEKLTDNNIHLDHIIPLAKGGAHVQSNVQPAHALCNCKKGDRV